MFDELWVELEAEAVGTGEVRRRIHPESPADLWLVVYGAGATRALRVAAAGTGEELGELPAGTGVDMSLGTVAGTGPVLEILLTNRSFQDLFDTLVSDIAAAAVGAAHADEVPGLVAARVRRWQAFLRAHVDGLSSERQRGLFGELHVLSSAAEAIGNEAAVTGWMGPMGAPQDFAFGHTAVEVKTSAGKNPQRVRISSERQLDDSAVSRVYLWHLSVDERTGVGESLPALVGRLRSAFHGTAASVGLEETLFAAGYHDLHESRYVIGYSLRSSDIFEVREGFPRLTEADCPAGLGDVHYSLELGALTPFKVERRELFGALKKDSADG